MAEKRGWIGVDLDSTLAIYTGWMGETEIGDPIWPMVYRVRGWIEQGYDVRIFTARVAEDPSGIIAAAIQNWCVRNIGYSLPVTCKKDWNLIEYWDDRAVQVEENTGEPVEGSISRLEEE
jgi:hypothetical protein